MGGKDLQDLKHELGELAAAVDPDVSAMVSLVAKIAEKDTDNVWFTVDAGLINRLGRELVRRQETAVAELVKNSYDADATTVTVTYLECDSPGGTMVIEDDGAGMSRAELSSGFMRLSTTNKQRDSVSPGFGRTRAGRKGIGRFSTQRLAERLILTTQTVDAEDALCVEIRWDDFASNRELGSIGNTIRSVPKAREKGTTLRLEGVRDSWTAAQIRRAYRHVQGLIEPYPVSIGGEDKGGGRDPGFTARFYAGSEEQLYPVADEQRMIFDFAIVSVIASVDEHGIATMRMTSPHSDEIFEERKVGAGFDFGQLAAQEDVGRAVEANRYSELRNVHLTAHYFFYGPKAPIPPHAKSRIRELSKTQAGIRVYRNGFRVLPYGAADDDWLGLNREFAKKSWLMPRGNENFFGHVWLDDANGEVFEETAARDGLVETTAFEQLKHFGYEVLSSAAWWGAKISGLKTHTNEPGWEQKRRAKSVESTARQLRAVVDAAQRRSESGGKSSGRELKKASAIIEDLIVASEAGSKSLEELIDELEMLRVLASLGLSTGQFIHELDHLLAAYESDAGLLLRDQGLVGKGLEYARRLENNAVSLRELSSFFGMAIADNAIREKRAMSLRDVVNDFRDGVGPLLRRRRVELTLEASGYDLFSTPMHPSEWSSVLTNLYSNAEKSIRLRGIEGKMLIRFGRIADGLFLEFHDNGCGIPEAAKERVFDAFYTTTASLREDGGGRRAGTGLGLYITKGIIQGAKGTIRLSRPADGYVTCVRILVPEATEAERPE